MTSTALVLTLHALHTGGLGAARPPGSVREEVRLVASETVLREGLAPASPWAAQGALGAEAPAPGDALAPQAFRGHRPADWIAQVAGQLHLESTSVVRAALWIATRPVEVEASTQHVFVRVRIAGR
jgi:hypothetical protein